MSSSEYKYFLEHQAQTTAAPMGLEIKKAKGSYITDIDNKRYLDFVAGVSVVTLYVYPSDSRRKTQNAMEPNSHIGF